MANRDEGFLNTISDVSFPLNYWCFQTHENETSF